MNGRHPKTDVGVLRSGVYRIFLKKAVRSKVSACRRFMAYLQPASAVFHCSKMDTNDVSHAVFAVRRAPLYSNMERTSNGNSDV